MPFGEISDFQQTNVVTFQEMRQRIEDAFGPLEEASYDFVDPVALSVFPARSGTLGFISSVTEPFCQAAGVFVSRQMVNCAFVCCVMTKSIWSTPLRAWCEF